MKMLYLLGFPTPVLEIYLLLAGSVIAFALYFALTFEDVDRTETADRTEGPEDDEQVTEVSG